MNALAENYYALALCILTDTIPEKAFMLIFGDQETRAEKRLRETLEMVNLKEQGLTYKQIGRLYGVRIDAVWKRLKKYYQESG